MSCALVGRGLSIAAAIAAILSLVSARFGWAQAPADPGAAPAPAPMTRALKDVPVDAAKVARLGTKHYHLWADRPVQRHEHRVQVTEMTRKSAGTVVVSTSVGPERMVFRDSWWDLTGKLLPVEAEISYPVGKFLSPLRMAIELPGARTTTDLSRGKYSLGWRGYKRSGDWPADTLTLPALLRLGAVLPREKGVAYTFSYFTPIPEINIQENSDPLVCLGPSLCKVFGRKMPCTKWAWGDVRLWYRDCDGALIRLHRPGYVTLDLEHDLNPAPECCERIADPAAPLVPVPMPMPAPGAPAAPREDRVP